MKRAIASLVAGLFLAAVAVGQNPIQPQPVETQTLALPLLNPPQQIPSALITPVGPQVPFSTQQLCYWIVSTYTIGNSGPAGPYCWQQPPATLSVSSYLNISWMGATGASTYDVLRTTTPQPPSGACNCAVIKATSGNAVNDQGSALQSYTVATFNPNSVKVQLSNEAISAGASQLTLRQNGVSLGSLVTPSGSYNWTGAQNLCKANGVALVDATNKCGWSGSDFGAWVNSAIASLPANVAGTVILPNGQFTATTTIAPRTGVRIIGQGDGSTNFGGSTQITNSTGDVFAISAAADNVEIADLQAISGTGGGHVLNWTGQNSSNWNVHDVIFTQQNPGKSVVAATNNAAGVNIENTFRHFIFYYQVTNSVPAVDLESTDESLTYFHEGLFVALGSGAGGNYALKVGTTAAASSATNIDIRNAVFEVPQGGAILFDGVSQSAIENVWIGDLTAGTQTNKIIDIEPGFSNQANNGIRMDRIFSQLGTAALPDIYVNDSSGSNTYTLSNSNLTYLSGVSNPLAAIAQQGNTIGTQSSITYPNSVLFGTLADGWQLTEGTAGSSGETDLGRTANSLLFRFLYNGNFYVPYAGMMIGGSAPTVAAGQVGYGSGTSASTSCGSLSGAAGCLVINVGGTTHYIPYY